MSTHLQDASRKRRSTSAKWYVKAAGSVSVCHRLRLLLSTSIPRSVCWTGRKQNEAQAGHHPRIRYFTRILLRTKYAAGGHKWKKGYPATSPSPVLRVPTWFWRLLGCLASITPRHVFLPRIQYSARWNANKSRPLSLFIHFTAWRCFLFIFAIQGGNPACRRCLPHPVSKIEPDVYHMFAQAQLLTSE